MSGTSDSAKRRLQLKERDPQKYAEMLQKHNDRYKEAKRKREEYWASGTRQALDDKEAYYAKRRTINRKSFQKQQTNNSSTRTTRASIEATPTKDRVNRKVMSPEERREHDLIRRKERKERKSRQKQSADRIAHAKYMRAWRQSKKGGTNEQIPGPSLKSSSLPLPVPQDVPITQEETLAMPHVPATSTSPLPMQPCTSTPKLKRSKGCINLQEQTRMRQHCYNTASKIKAVLKSSFTSEESANMSARIVLRKTPQKRHENLNRLLDYPEVQAYCRKKLHLEPSGFEKKSSASKKLRESLQASAKKRFDTVKSEISRFYRNTAVSRILPHKRYATKWGPGYVMVMSLKNAHQAYQTHHGRKVGFSTFAGLRPRNVRKLGSVPVDTCLCVTCTNIKLKIDSLNRVLGRDKAIVAESKLLKFLLCPFQGHWPKKDCISGSCSRCSDHVRPFTAKCFDIYFEQLKWFHWERREFEGKKKLDIHAYNGTVGDLLEQLAGDLQNPTRGTTFVQHLFTAYWQQSQYDLAKDSLQQGQIMLVQDFAENRKATYSEEVKSAHFGKAQISLHPTVAFYVNSNGEQVRHVAMFFSDDIGHDYHAVHCYTQKMVEILQNETPVREVIIWSDGAASQYKGRGSFADLSLYPFPVQRNFFGSEHGKGEADGETGRFSQAMARAVAKGHSFKDAKDMVDFGAATYSSEPLRKYSFVLVKKEEIVRERPETDVSTLPGTRSFHQVLRRKNYVVSARQLSCFCTGCKEEKFECCINTSFVQQFETFKMKPSKPAKIASVVDEVEDLAHPVFVDKVPSCPTYTSSEIPQVGEWLEIIGTIQTKKSQLDKTYFANVVSPPEDGSGDFFYCQFFKETSSGSYTANPRLYQIVPGTEENYRWRRIPAPHTNARGHFFFN